MPELKIDHIGASGDGVAYDDGQTYYIPFTAPGDIINADIKEKRGKGFAAEMTELLTSSDERVKPVCRHFGTCGGCALQHLSQDKMELWKQDRIREAISRAGISDATVNPIISSAPKTRRRVEFVVSKRKKGVMIGYHLKRSHQIFDVGECPLLEPELMALVKPLRAVLPQVMPRNSKARITLTATKNGPDLLISGKLPINLEIREILAQFANEEGLSRISVYQEDERLLEILAARKDAAIKVGKDEVTIPPGGFLQATEDSQNSLISMMLDALPRQQKTLDLFSGCGSFSLPASRVSKTVHAVEGDEPLVFALQNAANSEMLPITTEYRDLFRRPLIPDELNKFDVLIIDPPRSGAEAQISEIANSRIETVIFISCNPTSFARDAKTLIDAGYQMQEVTPVDQFLWSTHIELFTVFKLSDDDTWG